MPHPCATTRIRTAEPWSSLKKLVWKGGLPCLAGHPVTMSEHLPNETVSTCALEGIDLTKIHLVTFSKISLKYLFNRLLHCRVQQPSVRVTFILWSPRCLCFWETPHSVCHKALPAWLGLAACSREGTCITVFKSLINLPCYSSDKKALQ